MEHGLATLSVRERVPRPDMPTDVDTMIEFRIRIYLTAVKFGPAAFKTAADKAANDAAASLSRFAHDKQIERATAYVSHSFV